MTFLTVGNETGPTALVPDLVRHATAQTCIARHLTGPFLVPDIVAALAGYDRQTLMIAGFSAETAVIQTALGALAAGYTVYVPVDCTGSRTERTEAATFREMERAGVTTSSLRSLLLRMAPDLSCAPGADVIRLLGNFYYYSCTFLRVRILRVTMILNETNGTDSVEDVLALTLDALRDVFWRRCWATSRVRPPGCGRKRQVIRGHDASRHSGGGINGMLMCYAMSCGRMWSITSALPMPCWWSTRKMPMSGCDHD